MKFPKIIVAFIMVATSVLTAQQKEVSLEEIWNGESYKKLRKMHVTGKFPEGHKCLERCDQKKIFQYLKPKKNSLHTY